MASLRVLVAIAPVSLQNYVIEDFLIIREIGEDQSHHAMTQPINATRRLRTPTTHAWKFTSLSYCDQGWASVPGFWSENGVPNTCPKGEIFYFGLRNPDALGQESRSVPGRFRCPVKMKLKKLVFFVVS